MANGRQRSGGLGGLPFPTFNAGGEKGVIPQLQLRPAPINFPRAGGGGGSRSKGVNPAAYFAPGLLSLIGDKILPKPDVKQRQPNSDPRIEKILRQADATYGADREAPTLFQELLPMGIDALAAAGFGDEGGAQYAQTAINRRIANRKSERGIAADKRAFIAGNLYPKVSHVNVMEQNAARANVSDKRIGRTYEGDPALYVPASAAEIAAGEANDDGFRKTKQNESWIQVARPGEGGANPMDNYGDKNLTKLADGMDARKEIDSSTVQVMTVAENVLDQAQLEYQNGNKISSTGIVSTVLKLGDDARQGFSDAAVSFGFDNTNDFFAIRDEGGSDGRFGLGQASQSLYNSIQSVDPQEQLNALNTWVETADISDSAKNAFREEFLEGVSLDNVQQKAALLQLAYLAAAANGQTGRTLSDKDLAYHLQIVGYGATQNPGVLHDNLIGFVDLLISSNDNKTQVLHNPGTWARYKFDNPSTGQLFSDELGYFYRPIEGAKWSDEDKIFSENYKFKTFYDRYAGIPVTEKFAARNYLISTKQRKGFDTYFPDRDTAAGGGTGTRTGTGTGTGSVPDIYTTEIPTGSI